MKKYYILLDETLELPVINIRETEEEIKKDLYSYCEKITEQIIKNLFKTTQITSPKKIIHIYTKMH